MVNRTSFEWNSIENRLIDVLEICKNDLPSEAREFVKQYLVHAEYEMAGEGLFIDIMKMRKIPKGLTKKMCLDLARELGLDKEVVYQNDFWMRFSEFCNQYLPD